VRRGEGGKEGGGGSRRRREEEEEEEEVNTVSLTWIFHYWGTS